MYNTIMGKFQNLEEQIIDFIARFGIHINLP